MSLEKKKNLLAEFLREFNLIFFRITYIFHICATQFISDVVRIAVAFNK